MDIQIFRQFEKRKLLSCSRSFWKFGEGISFLVVRRELTSENSSWWSSAIFVVWTGFWSPVPPGVLDHIRIFWICCWSIRTAGLYRFFWFWFKRQDLHGSSPRQPRAYIHRHFNPQPFIEGESRIITFFLSASPEIQNLILMKFLRVFSPGVFHREFSTGSSLLEVLQRELSYQEHYSSQESLLDQDLLILQGLWWLYSSLESGIWISSPTCSWYDGFSRWKYDSSVNVIWHPGMWSQHPALRQPSPQQLHLVALKPFIATLDNWCRTHHTGFWHKNIF